jgi:rfaE bifunctional protein nucleotidyltransferase chain/domain
MKQKQTMVYTYGVFDLFHRGHLELLRDAKALGGKLIVGIFTDEIARSFKREPIIKYEDRAAVVAGCKYVDQVIKQRTLAPDIILRLLKPDILAKGPGAGWEKNGVVPGKKTMSEIGGKVVKLNYHNGISTSQIIDKVKKS